MLQIFLIFIENDIFENYELENTIILTKIEKFQIGISNSFFTFLSSNLRNITIIIMSKELCLRFSICAFKKKIRNIT